MSPRRWALALLLALPMLAAAQPLAVAPGRPNTPTRPARALGAPQTT